MGLLAGAGGVGVAGRVILLGDVVVVLTMTPLWFYLSLGVDPRQHPFVHPDVEPSVSAMIVPHIRCVYRHLAIAA